METMSSKVDPKKSKIQSFYEDKTILLTGGTGFLGKVLVEKLLRSCPNIKQIYLLVREKRGMSAHERLETLLESEVFTNLKRDHPGFSKQLTVVPGDLSQPGLGLSPEHVTSISQNVQIIFHSAATLRFDEQLSIAISTNVSATKNLCLLAQNIDKLEAFVYVSTAYCHCDTPLVQEKVSPCKITPEELMKLPELLDNETLDQVTPALLGSKPNTYIFTKCAAEEIIDKFKTSLPVAVFRPSIMLAAVSEPIPGWIDNVQGPTGMAVGLSAGLVHTALYKYKAKGNFVPVDYTVNGIIALGYSVGQRQWETPEELPIINFVSTAGNPISWGRFGDLIQFYAWQNPSEKLVWYPFAVRSINNWSYAVLKALFHYLPATVIDWLTAKLGRPTRLKDFYNKLDKYAAVVVYFATREFEFEEANAEKLWKSLELADQVIFPFNMASLDWDLYILEYVRGCRRFLFKEDAETIAMSRKRIKMLYFLHLMTTSTLFFVLVKIIVYVVRLVNKRKSLCI